MVSPAGLCIICKGSRNLCGKGFCPYLTRTIIKPKIEKIIDKEFFGPSVSVFVGRSGYPNIWIGPMTMLEEKPEIDNPKTWFGMDYEKIIELRSLLLRSKHKQNIRSSSKFVQETQELALASKPTDIEAIFFRKPVYRISFSEVLQPMGPTAVLEKMRITENPRIPAHIERIVSDELKAQEAGFLLYKHGHDVYKISTILSSGVLGRDEKKLVPTRWSITAVDNIIFLNLIQEIKEFPSISEYMVYSSEFLDNRFEILLIPGNWEYENFEAWAPGSFWAFSLKKPEILEEYEPFQGRKDYAETQGGGYYAARLAVAEGLYRMKKQARVVVFREVYEGYVIPLGVWQVRENVRNAFRNKPAKFDNLGEALKHIASRLRIPMEEYINRSKILRQKRLYDFYISSETLTL